MSNLNRYLTVAGSLASSTGIIMHRLKSSKFVENTLNYSSRSNSTTPEPTSVPPTSNPTSSTHLHPHSNSHSNSHSQPPPMISVQSVFVRSPRVANLNGEWYSRAKRVIAGNNDLFSLYASSHSMPNLSVTIHADHHQGKSWSNGASESEEGASSTADPTGASSSPPLISEKEKEATAAAAANGYNVFGSNVSLSPTATDPLNAKKLSELDNLLFPRIQDKQGRAAAAAAAAANAKRGRRTPSVVSFAEKTVEQLNQERMKNKKTLLSHYFEDGQAAGRLRHCLQQADDHQSEERGDAPL
ncbi:hypothetical protein TYRP_006128 [Tyrophagus putrescentiae]|nr:hypothetical protein TYRP_006128 [Tyrophagus putrescentiae]